MSSTAILPSILPTLRPSTIFSLGRVVERAQNQSAFEAVLRVHRPQQRHRRELAALVDADGELSFLRGVQLDPAAALGNDAAAVQPAFAGFHLGDEVDAGAAVQLAHHDALGAVDDELAAAEHDRHVAQVDFFLDRLLFGRAAARRGTAGRRSAAAGGIRPARSAACPARSGGIRA